MRSCPNTALRYKGEFVQKERNYYTCYINIIISLIICNFSVLIIVTNNNDGSGDDSDDGNGSDNDGRNDTGDDDSDQKDEVNIRNNSKSNN